MVAQEHVPVPVGDIGSTKTDLASFAMNHGFQTPGARTSVTPNKPA